MRVFQRVLLFLGLPALGIMICGMAVPSLLAFMLFRARAGEDPSLNWGSAIVFTFLAIGGSIVGGIGGVVQSIRWSGRTGNAPWEVGTWIGIACGLLAAILLRQAGIFATHILGDVIRWWPGFACFAAAGSALGGLVSVAIARRAWKSDEKRAARSEE